MNELDKILEGLAKRTLDGRLKWSPSAKSNEFVTSINAISVKVEEFRQMSKTAPLISPQVVKQRLTIFNENGEAAEVLETGSENGDEVKQSQQLDELFTLARRSALNTKATLEKLAKALEA